MVSKLPWCYLGTKNRLWDLEDTYMNTNQCLMLLGSHHFPRLHLVKPLETTVLLMFLADAQKQNIRFISV